MGILPVVSGCGRMCEHRPSHPYKVSHAYVAVLNWCWLCVLVVSSVRSRGRCSGCVFFVLPAVHGRVAAVAVAAVVVATLTHTDPRPQTGLRTGSTVEFVAVGACRYHGHQIQAPSNT